jgi:methionyl-tRNA formyltransferase
MDKPIFIPIGKNFFDLDFDQQSAVIDRLLRGLSPNPAVRATVERDDAEPDRDPDS